MLINREKEIIALVEKGYNCAEIAKILFISHHTVKAHMIRIKKKIKILS